MGIPSEWLFENECAGCGKRIKTPATNRSGDVGLVYCNSVCRTLYEDKKKFNTHKTIVDYKKSLSTADITKKISKVGWSGYAYNSRPELV